ncbi:MAG: regulator [Nitrospirae bacterium]|nr:regulator [Nitrospirota bacterium]
MNRIATLALLAAALLVAACSRAEQVKPDRPLIPAEGAVAAPPPAPGPLGHKVGELFQVGAAAYVRSLYVRGDDLYVGTSTGVVVVDRNSGNVRRTFSMQDGMRDPYAFVVRPAPDGGVWMGTNSGGLAIYRDGAVQNYLPKHGLADIWVYDVAWAEDGSAWIATWDGVNHVTGSLDDKANWQTFNTDDGLANPWVYAIQIDRAGAVWFGTEGGLSRYVNGQWTTWLQKDGLGAPNPRQLASSPLSGFGSKQAGEHSHDLTTLDPGGRETYNENYVFSLLLDPDQTLWIGTWGGGVAHFDGQTFSNLTEADGLAGNVVYSIARDDGDGSMWFGTNRGISRYDGKGWTTFTQADGLVGDDVYTLAIDPDHVVWAGQKGAVVKLVPLLAGHGGGHG